MKKLEQREKYHPFYRIARNAAVVTGIFSMIVSVIIIANFLSLRWSDPVNSPVLKRLILQVQSGKEDKDLIDTVREYDYLARKAFFTSIAFSRFGSYMLLAGISLFLISLKLMYEFKRPIPDPGKFIEVEEGNSPGKVFYYCIGLFVGCVFIAALVIPNLIEDPMNTSGRNTETLQKSTSKNVLSVTDNSNYATKEEMEKNWPSFRGFRCHGIALNRDPVLDWDEETGKNIIWKTLIAKQGFNSPMVWENNVFVTGGDENSRDIFCLDVQTGKILWTRKISNKPKQEMPEVTEDTGFAAPTMATDGRFVSAIFATGELITLDFNGKVIWQKNLGVPENNYGHSSSLITWGGILFVQFDQDAGSKFLAYNMLDGKVVFNIAREAETAWTSPIIIPAKSGTQIILNGTPNLTAYDITNGKNLWEMTDVVEGELGPSPAYYNGKLYVANAYSRFVCIDLEKQKIIWKHDNDLPDTSSPTAYDNLLILPSGYGKITCYNATTGKKLWEHEYKKGFYSSPIIVEIANKKNADGKPLKVVFLMDKKGKMHIFELAENFRRISDPCIKEDSMCTPAFKGNLIFIRSSKHLYCIGRKK